MISAEGKLLATGSDTGGSLGSGSGGVFLEPVVLDCPALRARNVSLLQTNEPRAYICTAYTSIYLYFQSKDIHRASSLCFLRLR